MNEQALKDFSNQWINAWNSHDINKIIEHYAEEVVFHSPYISLLKFNAQGVITNRSDLKRYFEIGLNAYPNLEFKLHNCFIGINSIVIYYTSVNGTLAAEMFTLNNHLKATSVYCNYSTNPSKY